MKKHDINVAYLCDKKKCEVCNNPECMHTLDIKHASIFYEVEANKYMEHFKPSITLERFVKCFVSEDEQIQVFCPSMHNSPDMYAYIGTAAEIIRDKIDKDLANRKVCNIGTIVNGTIYIVVM